jgi:hypothetical protein
MKRVNDVVRIQMVYWPGLFGWPLGILALTFVVNLVVFGSIGDAAPPEGRVTGAIMSIYIVMLIAHLQTITQVFPFALGLSVTRKAFYLGTAVVVAAQSVLFGLLLVLLEQVEQATNGWGLQLRFFGLDFLVQDNLVAQWLVYTVPFLALSALGVVLGVIFKRWGQTGLYVALVGSAVVLTAAVLMITWQKWWGSVGSFFTEQSTLALVAGYPLLIAVALGGLGFLAIRRATP